MLLLLAVTTGVFAPVLFGYGIYLGFRGNRIVAANRRFSSLAEFLAVQRAWSTWGFVAFLVQHAVFGSFVSFIIVLSVLAALAAR